MSSTDTQEAPQVKVMFAHQFSEAVIVRLAKETKYGAGGQRIGESRGSRIRFEGGLYEAVVGRYVLETYDEESDRSRTEDEVEFLRRYAATNPTLVEIPPIAPDAAPMVAKVMAAALAHDAPALVELYEEERTTWQRPQVLAPLTQAINELAAEIELPEVLAEDARPENATVFEPVRKGEFVDANAEEDDTDAADRIPGAPQRSRTAKAGFEPEKAGTVERRLDAPTGIKTYSGPRP